VALPVNSIGVFTFLSLEGSVEALKQELELVRRPGVEGVGLWKTGVRGRPFRLRSKANPASKAAARSLFRLYCNLIGADPVRLVWSDIRLEATERFRVAVLDVRQVDCRTLASSSSGLLGWLEADWDLIPIRDR
jgi:hypothetical protein